MPAASAAVALRTTTSSFFRLVMPAKKFSCRIYAAALWLNFASNHCNILGFQQSNRKNGTFFSYVSKRYCPLPAVTIAAGHHAMLSFHGHQRSAAKQRRAIGQGRQKRKGRRRTGRGWRRSGFR